MRFTTCVCKTNFYPLPEFTFTSKRKITWCRFALTFCVSQCYNNGTKEHRSVGFRFPLSDWKRVAVDLWLGDGYFFLLLENLVAEADDSNKYQTELQSIVNTHSHPSSPEGTRAKEVATLLVEERGRPWPFAAVHSYYIIKLWRCKGIRLFLDASGACSYLDLLALAGIFHVFILAAYTPLSPFFHAINGYSGCRALFFRARTSNTDKRTYFMYFLPVLENLFRRPYCSRCFSIQLFPLQKQK